MKKKIVEIVILMLVATTMVSATNVNVKEKIQPVSSSVDVPVWKVGDSWTYNEKYHQTWYNKNGEIIYFWFHNCTNIYSVTADNGDNYTLKVKSSNDEGSLRYGILRLKFTPSVKFTEEIQYRKTDLGYIKYSHQEKGFAFLLLGKIGIPIPAQYSDIWEASFNPTLIFLPFPFTDGTNGTIPGCNETGHEKMGIYWGLIKFINKDFIFNSPPLDYKCEMADITVPAGTYNAYNISTDIYLGSSHNYTRIYYVPEVGNYIKYIDHFEDVDLGMPTQDSEYELVSSTYTP